MNGVETSCQFIFSVSIFFLSIYRQCWSGPGRSSQLVAFACNKIWRSLSYVTVRCHPSYVVRRSMVKVTKYQLISEENSLNFVSAVRSLIVNPFIEGSSAPPVPYWASLQVWAMFAAFIPAILLYSLLFMETHICELIMMDRSSAKGNGLHMVFISQTDMIYISFSSDSAYNSTIKLG